MKKRKNKEIEILDVMEKIDAAYQPVPTDKQHKKVRKKIKEQLRKLTFKNGVNEL